MKSEEVSAGAGLRQAIFCFSRGDDHVRPHVLDAVDDHAIAALEPFEHDAPAVHLFAELDLLSVVCEVSWPYDDAPGLLAARLGAAPAVRALGPVGGETPIRFVHEAALAIARGECRVAAVVGAESQYSLNNAVKAGITPPWLPRSDAPASSRRSN